MSIRAKCRHCGKVYQVGEERAGKKLRCKECGEAVLVPRPKTVAFEEEEYGDSDFGGAGYDEPARPPRRKKKPLKKRTAKTKTRRRKSQGTGLFGKVLLFIGAGIGGLVVLSFVVGLISVLSKNIGLLEWQKYTTPDGAATMNMPGTPKRMSVAVVAPGGQSFGVDRGFNGCIVTIEPLPANITDLNAEEFYNAVQQGLQSINASNFHRRTIDGVEAIAYDMEKKGIKSSNVALVHKGKTYTFSYAYRGNRDPEMESKFLDEITLN